MFTNAKPSTAGEDLRGSTDITRGGCIRQRVVVSAASATGQITKVLPKGAKMTKAAVQIATLVTLAGGATRLGVGTAADPDLCCISGAVMTAGTIMDPMKGPGQVVLSFATQAASASIAPVTTAETSCGQTFSIPANLLKPGDRIRIRSHGQQTTNATGANDTLTVKVKVGSTILAATPAVDPTDGDIWVIDVEAVIRKIGATGAIISNAQTYLGTPAAASAADIPTGSNVAETAIDTTAAQTIDVTVTSSGNAGSAWRGRQDTFSVEIIRTGDPDVTADTTLVVTALSDAGIATGTFVGTVDVFVYYDFTDQAVTPVTT